MRNWDTRDESGTDVGCEWEKDWQDVQSVCQKLDIPCRMVGYFHRSVPVAFDTHEQKSLDRPVKRLLAESVRARDQDMGEGPYSQSRCLV
jgi:tRNA methyl transferase